MLFLLNQLCQLPAPSAPSNTNPYHTPSSYPQTSPPSSHTNTHPYPLYYSAYPSHASPSAPSANPSLAGSASISIQSPSGFSYPLQPSSAQRALPPTYSLTLFLSSPFLSLIVSNNHTPPYSDPDAYFCWYPSNVVPTFRRCIAGWWVIVGGRIGVVGLGSGVWPEGRYRWYV